MYVEDLDLCWRLAQSGWRRRLEVDISIPHVGHAAAAQAWGGDQTIRWIPASYDWYAEVHGAPAMRRWAVVNSLGVAAQMGTSTILGMIGRRSARSRARQLARQLPLHARVVIGRPRVPTSPPLR